MVALRSLFALLLLLLIPAAASSLSVEPDLAREHIRSFVSSVKIEADGTLDVTEAVTINVLNQQIVHGIYRDFPTIYRDALGGRVKVGFEVVAVELDRRAEPWMPESVSNGIRIRIGSGERIVPRGDHIYMLHYRTTRQIRRGKDSDELYWNATGNGWVFPIDRAEVRVTLPTKVAFSGKEVWTGPQGSTEHHAAIAVDRPGYIVFRTTKALESYEGITVSARFPKSVLTE